MSEECEVEEEDEVILRTIGVVVVFAGVEEGKACVALFEGTAGACEEGTRVLNLDSHGVKAATPLLADH
jgi:hypothetical protein